MAALGHGITNLSDIVIETASHHSKYRTRHGVTQYLKEPESKAVFIFTFGEVSPCSPHKDMEKDRCLGDIVSLEDRFAVDGTPAVCSRFHWPFQAVGTRSTLATRPEAAVRKHPVFSRFECPVTVHMPSVADR